VSNRSNYKVLGLEFQSLIFVSFSTTYIFIYSVVHEAFHWITALILRCNPELGLSHVQKDNCQLLELFCKASEAWGDSYCLNDALVSVSGPLGGFLWSAIALFILGRFRSRLTVIVRYFLFLNALFHWRFSFNWVTEKIFRIMGKADSLRMGDEERISWYFGWDYATLSLFLNLLSVFLLIGLLKFLGWKEFLKFLLHFSIGAGIGLAVYFSI